LKRHTFPRLAQGEEEEGCVVALWGGGRGGAIRAGGGE